jgi:hypothetical protein
MTRILILFTLLFLTTGVKAGDSITFSGQPEYSERNQDKRTNAITTTMNYVHSFSNGFALGAQYNFSSAAKTNTVKSYAEVNGYYTYKITDAFSVRAGLGVGERFQARTSTYCTGNFPYVALYGNADYKLTDKLTWNAISYRYRNAADKYQFENHQIGTGLTYAINDTHAVGFKVYKNTDKSLKPTSNALSVFYKVSF